MKPFNLEKALAGEKVINRIGQQVLDLYLLKNLDSPHKLIGHVDGYIERWNSDTGKYYPSGKEHPNDLFMAATKKTYWIGIGDVSNPQVSLTARTTTYAYENKEDAQTWFHGKKVVSIEIEE